MEAIDELAMVPRGRLVERIRAADTGYDSWMTAKERLHRLVDELSDDEAQAALRIMAFRHSDADVPEGSVSVVLDDEQAQRFLDALDDPAAFEHGLRRLVQRPRVLGE